MPTTIPTVPPARIYRRADLEAEGFPPTTIRYYISLGLLPRAHGRGPHAYYTDEHLNRLKAIRREREARCTLADFRERFASPRKRRTA